MIDFCLRIPKRGKLTALRLLPLPWGVLPSEIPGTADLYLAGGNAKTSNQGNAQTIGWGDFVMPETKQGTDGGFQELSQHFTIDRLRDTGGLFYLVRFLEKEGRLEIYNSMFSLTPLYHYWGDNTLWVSSRGEYIRRFSEIPFPVDKQFILERVLFNYSLGERTFFTNISLVPANAYLSFNPAPRIVKHTHIAQFFIDNPRSWKKSGNEVARFFLDRVKHYFPPEHFDISFTGGFDGRTITAAALYHQKAFSTYAFGTSDYFDIHLPLAQSHTLNIPFTPLYLDRGYVGEKSLEYGLEFVRSSEGGASFARGHYVYAARELAKKSKFIISGNFGSELLRSLHLTGVMVSKNLANIFTANSLGQALRSLTQATELEGLNINNFKDEMENLLSHIQENPVFQRGKTPANHRFYTFMYEEVFRKYFGPELMMQSQYLMNRAPFMDFRFIELLLETQLSSVYSKLLEQNPFKRFKGQVLYAHILKLAHPELANLPVSKGYRPADLLTFGGKLRIFRNYISGNKGQPTPARDPFSVGRSFASNKDTLLSWPIDQEIFNPTVLRQETVAPDQLDRSINLLSLVYFKNHCSNFTKKKK